MIVYEFSANGQANNLRFETDNYILKLDEHTVTGDELPEIDTLHSVEYKTAQAQKELLREAETIEVYEDNLLKQLKNLTPQQAADWVQNNVTDLATAKTVLKVMAKVIVYLLRYKLR